MNRLEAFLSNRHEIFHAVQHKHEIWRHDPFDVPEIHAPARAEFQRLLTLATTPPGLPAGRVMLLLGDSGCGKTHLVRAFRNYAHGADLGVVAYLQMTTEVNRYAQYLLSNLIESLDLPYDERRGEVTGLMKFSTALANAAGSAESALLADERPRTPAELEEIVSRAADSLTMQKRYADLDVDLLRALLYLQREDPRIKSRILKYLRCEDLSPPDRALLGGMVPRLADDASERVLEFFGKLMGRFNHALVICVDQIEDMFSRDDAQQHHRRMCSTLTAIADRVPSSVIVIACLDQYWTQLRTSLSRSLLDRIEKDPAPLVLEAQRTPREAERLVARRLEHLYALMGAPFDPAHPTDPIPAAMVQSWGNRRSRDVLEKAHGLRELSARAGKLAIRIVPPRGSPLSAPPPLGMSAPPPARPGAPLGGPGSPPPSMGPKPLSATGPGSSPSSAGRARPTSPGLGAPPPALSIPAPPRPDPRLLARRWNDFRATHRADVPDEDEELLAILHGALLTQARERGLRDHKIARLVPQGLEFEIGPAQLLAGICNASARGGALRAQLSALAKSAGKRTPLLVRSTPFPNSPRTEIGKQLADLGESRGARQLVIEDSSWRAMMAMAAFLTASAHEPGLEAWLQSERPLSQLPLFVELFPPEDAPSSPGAVARSAPSPASASTAASAAGGQLRSVRAGATELPGSSPLLLSHAAIAQHVGLLGGPGSEPAALALRLIEQLLVQGVPAIIVDRSGALASHARGELWSSSSAAQGELRRHLEVSLFTPGEVRGRPLAIPLLPLHRRDLKAPERDELADQIAAALGALLGYRDTARTDRQCRLILERAMRLLAEAKGQPDLDALIALVRVRSPELLAAVGRLEARLFQRLAEDLETFKLTRAERLFGKGEPLEVDALLGKGSREGTARLSIISTRFLGGEAEAQFWMTHLLSDLSHWADRHPSSGLQGVLLLDEAEQYLPAQGRPAAQEPLEGLLGRAGQAGLGLLLATQSPAEFDLRARAAVHTWFLGRTQGEAQLKRLRPLLAAYHAELEEQLPKQAPGQFQLLRQDGLASVRAERPLLGPAPLSDEKLVALAASIRPR